MKHIRISTRAGEMQRLVVPDDATVEIVKDSISQFYNGQRSISYCYSIEIKQGSDVLARIMNVNAFRNEAIEVQKLQVTDDEAEWVPTE